VLKHNQVVNIPKKKYKIQKISPKMDKKSMEITKLPMKKRNWPME
jgi:hypothetical protein